MAPSNSRPPIAANINTVLHLLHGQHILDRFLDGYGWDGAYHRTTLADFFSPLVHHIEQLFLTSKAQYPVQRALLTNGILIAGVDSLFQNQQRIEMPHLNINYQPNPQSTFWRS